MKKILIASTLTILGSFSAFAHGPQQYEHIGDITHLLGPVTQQTQMVTNTPPVRVQPPITNHYTVVPTPMHVTPRTLPVIVPSHTVPTYTHIVPKPRISTRYRTIHPRTVYPRTFNHRKVFPRSRFGVHIDVPLGFYSRDHGKFRTRTSLQWFHKPTF